jgi:fermentation-respiration switch protein FrsA (DUF1100 family)
LPSCAFYKATGAQSCTTLGEQMDRVRGWAPVARIAATTPSRHLCDVRVKYLDLLLPSKRPSSAFMFRKQIDRLVYFPTVHPARDWHLQAGLGAIDVRVRAFDDLDLHAWWLEKNDSQLATLFMHGECEQHYSSRGPCGGNYRSRFVAASARLSRNRGYGRSPGHPSERGLYSDATAACQELLHRGFLPSQIILHGESLGTAVAVELATRVSWAALILESPFDVVGSNGGNGCPNRWPDPGARV